MRSFIAVLLCASMLPSQPSEQNERLSARIDSLIAAHPGRYAVAWMDLSSERSFLMNEHESFHAASTMKTPVMIEVFKQAALHRFSLDDTLQVKNVFKSIIDGSEYSLSISDDSDDGIYHQIGKHASIRQLVFQMITVSSNLATNILIELVGPANVMKTLRELGLTEINVLRGVEDSKAFRAGQNNTVTAYGLARMFRLIAEDKVISPEACASMREILRSQEFKSMIPAKLPRDVVVAHKTGSINKVQHDSGIITLPDGRQYVLVILSKELASNEDGIECIAEISKSIYEIMIK